MPSMAKQVLGWATDQLELSVNASLLGRHQSLAAQRSRLCRNGVKSIFHLYLAFTASSGDSTTSRRRFRLANRIVVSM